MDVVRGNEKEGDERARTRAESKSEVEVQKARED